MQKDIVYSPNAPKAIGPYSQGVRLGQSVYLSGQIPIDPITMELVTESFRAQAVQVFENLKAVAEAAGGTLNDIVNMTILLTDMKHFPEVNEVMSDYFVEPYPARAAFAVKGLPKNADIEIMAILATE
ncbi:MULTISPECIES: RidA family protein [Marinobacter]|jgi:reactive intermediate/imine deaminase|uniref:RidA family protein n=1 Tax=Marinobacter TaxID=2742 RepID=UPI0029435089|nr:RidA family protein [Marinobacter salarius]WOI20369.1 RidA family protein [Marinobacter salarius]